MINDCPENPGPERDKWIYDLIESGNFEVNFSEITSSIDGYEARFFVFSDALKIDGVRINVSAELQQRIADLLDCSLLTPKLADIIWDQREVTVSPHPRPIASDTASMISHSNQIDYELTALGVSGPKLLSTVGKHWTLDNELLLHPHLMAENYGWHFSGAKFEGISGDPTATKCLKPTRVIQGRGWRHNLKHTDYSQTCVLVHNIVIVNRIRSRIRDIASNPTLSYLMNHDGVLKVLRQPGVPEFTGTPLDVSSSIPDDEGLQI